MAVDLEGLEFEIKAATDKATHKLSSFSESLRGLHKAADYGLGRVSYQLERLNTTLSALSSDPIHKLSESLKAVSKIGDLSGIKLPENLGNQLTQLSKTVNDMDSNKLSMFSSAFMTLGALSNISISGDLAAQIGNVSKAVDNFSTTKAESISPALEKIKQSAVFAADFNITKQINELDTAVGNLNASLSNIPTDSFSAFSSASTSIEGLKISVSSFNTNDFEQTVKKISEILNQNVGTQFVDRFAKLKEINEGFNVANLNAIGQALYNVKANAGVYIPENFIDNLRLLSDTVKSESFDVAKLTYTSEALKSFVGVEQIKYPNGFNTAIRNLNVELSKLDVTNLPHLVAIGKAMEGFKGLGEIKISPAFANQIKSISQALEQLTESDIDKLQKLSEIMRGLDSLAPKVMRLKINTSDIDKAKKSNDSFKSDILSNMALLGTGISNALIAPIKGIGQVLTGVLSPAFSTIGNRLMKELNPDNIKAIFSKITSSIKTDFSDALKYFKTTGMFKDLKEDISTGRKNIGYMAYDIKSKISSAADYIKPKLEKTFGSLKTPKFFSDVAKKAEEVESDFSIISRAISDKLKQWFPETGFKKFFGDLQAQFPTIATGLNNIFVKPIQGIGQLAKVAAGLIPILSKAFTTPLKYAGKLSVALGKSILSPIQKIASRLKVVIAGFGKIIKLRAFRFLITSITGGIKEGTDNLYQFSKGINGEFAKSMDTLATSMLYFKNSVGAAIAPIINQLAPAVDILVDKIVEGTNKINQFLAQMTGATYWTKAVKYPKEYAEAVDNAKKSVQDFTMGFDELNIISDNAADKSASELDYSKMFELVDLQKNPWTEQLKNAIESGDWYGAGVLLGNKFNSVFESIDYEESGRILGAKIDNAISLAKGFLDIADFKSIGIGIGEFLNSAFEEIDFYNLGSVIADGFNVIINTVNGFVTEFKFSEFGKDLSEAVNGWFDTIDLNKAAQSIQIGLEGILDTAYNFLSNVDFRGIGEKIGDALNQFDIPTILGKFAQTASAFAIGVFDTLSGFLQKVDWQKLGTDIFDSVKKIIKNVDWANVTSSFAEFLGSAIGAVGGLLWGIIKPLLNLGWNLGEKFYDKFTEDGKFSWKGFLEGIKDAVKGVGNWVKEHILDPFMKGFKKAFGIASPSTVMKEQGGFIISGLKNGIAEALKNIKNWISEHIFQPFVDKFEEFKSDWSEGLNIIKDKFSNFKDNLSVGAENLKNSLAEKWNGIKSKISDTLETAFDTAKSNFTAFKNNWQSGAESIKSTLSEKWDSIKGKVSSTLNPLFDKAKENFGTFKSDWQSGWNDIKDKLSEKTDVIKEKISNLFNNPFDSLKSGANGIIWIFENMVNWVIYALNSMSRALNSLSFDIPDWVPEIGGSSFGLNLPEISEIQLMRFDKGGFPNSGDLFFANENGRPEFVGSMGGRTAVANNDQIVEGIYEAVYSAMMAVMSSQNNDGNTEFNLYLDSKQIAAKIEERKLSRGRTIFTGGVPNEF